MQTTKQRSLPWSSPEGEPALPTPDDNPDGPITRLANRMEAEQLAAGEAVLRLAREMLGARVRREPDECEFVMRRLAECLHDALRVADSRGCRLPVPVGAEAAT